MLNLGLECSYVFPPWLLSLSHLSDNTNAYMYFYCELPQILFGDKKVINDKSMKNGLWERVFH